MSGSGASNLGYGSFNPYNNSSFVNGTSSNYSGGFSSNEIPGLPGLAGSKSNIDAAAGIVPGICLFKGGAKKLKRKIKNITKRYKKMKLGSRQSQSAKNRLLGKMLANQMAHHRMFAGSRKTKQRRRGRSQGRSRSQGRTRAQRGGYSQYQNNLPLTPMYKVAGIDLPSNLSALANPAPYTVIGGNCVDNYDHYTNTGFPSRGH